MKLSNNPTLETIVDTAPIGICIVDAQSLTVAMVNDQFINISGKNREAFLGANLWEAFEEVFPIYNDTLRLAIQSGQTYQADEIQLTLLRRNRQELVNLTFTFVPIRDDQDVKNVAIWLSERTASVTAFENALIVKEATLNERNLMYESFSKAPVGIAVLTGKDLVFEFANSHYQEFLRHRSLLGRPISEALPELEGTLFAEKLQEVYETGIPAEFHNQLVPIAEQENGPTINRHFNFTFVPRLNQDGHVDGIYHFVIEVTHMVEGKIRADQTNNNLEQILNMLPASVVIIRGYDLIVEMINDTNLDYWKKRRDEVIGRPFLEILPDLADQPFAGQLRRVMQTGEVIDVKESPVLFTEPDGTIRETYVDYTYQALYDLDGNSNGVLVMSFEITDRVASRRLLEKYASELATTNDQLSILNNKLAKSEGRFKFLIQEAPVAIGVLHGKDFIVETANQKILEVWGKTKSIIGQPLYLALPELEGQVFLDILTGVFDSGKPFYANEIKALLEHDGTLKEIFFNLVYQPIADLQGTIADILIVAVDVTEQVNARKAVERSEQHFRRLADLVPAKISNALPTGEVTFFNKHWLDFAGMAFEEMRDFGYHQLMHPDEIVPFQTGLAAAAALGTPHISEMRFKNTEGHYVWHLNIASPILDDNGQITMWVGSATNIQELKEEEQRKSDFVSMLSHELKTPVTSIKGHVQLLLRLVAKEGKTAFSERLNSSLSRIDVLLVQLTGLIGDMLDLSRIDAGRMDLNTENFNICTLVTEVVEDFKLSHQQHFFKLEVCTAIEIHADRDRISQVLINLISNAIKYAPQSDVVDVTISRIADEVLIAIKDYGIGIEEKDQQKIFERFFRVEGQNEKHYSGFGIGLFLVQSIVKRHGGRISLESAKNKGSVFTVHLPI